MNDDDDNVVPLVEEVYCVDECDAVLKGLMGKFESFVIIGFFGGEFVEDFCCTDGKAQRIVLARLLQAEVDRELQEDFL